MTGAPEKNYKDVTKIKFGEHLIFDGYGCNPKKLDNLDHCVKILNDITKIAGMRKLNEPVAVKADSNETLGGKDPGGISAFVIIQESHISLHSFTRRGFVTVDVYSCKTFEAEEIIKYLNEAFDVKESDTIKLERGLKYPAENIY